MLSKIVYYELLYKIILVCGADEKYVSEYVVQMTFWGQTFRNLVHSCTVLNDKFFGK
jgi:hypothetical protein